MSVTEVASEAVHNLAEPNETVATIAVAVGMAVVAGGWGRCGPGGLVVEEVVPAAVEEGQRLGQGKGPHGGSAFDYL